ncbi:MAG: 2-oxo acid dehydrogenase subunit E2, partial [Acidimicrobiia bacterium]|nr:2-oxo acid dehydrogenase subunit E2 [Acidimicrobiia bacterium]
MSDYVFKVPDVGEGVAEAELVSWFVEVGDQVVADQRLAEVVTDKVSIELPSPISGVVVSLHGSPGERLAVGAELVILRPNGESAPPPELESIAPPPAAAEEPSVEPAPVDPTNLE